MKSLLASWLDKLLRSQNLLSTGFRIKNLGRLLLVTFCASLPHAALSQSTILSTKLSTGGSTSLGLADISTSAIARNLRLVNVPIGDTLAQHIVRDVLQDPEGFIWIGTDEGLYRYDGHETIAFHHSRAKPSSLSHDAISVLFLDSRGHIWIGTQGGGLNRFLGENAGFAHYLADPDKPGSLSHGHIRSIAEDANGQMWIGTAKGGLNRLTDTGFEQYRHDATRATSLPSDNVTSILEDKRGNLWIGTRNAGLARFDRLREEFISYQSNSASAQSLSDNHITRLVEDQQDRLWVATARGGLNLFDRERQTFSAFRHLTNQPGSLSSDRVHDVLLDSKGTLWVATDNGLNEMQSNGTFVRYEHNQADTSTLSSDRIYRLLQDTDGVMWIGTRGGLNRWNYISSAFAYLDPRTGLGHDKRVTAIAERDAAEGQGAELWIGSKNDGLIRLDLDTNQARVFSAAPGKAGALPDNHITGLHLTANDELWIGTAQGGALKLTLPPTSAQTADPYFQTLAELSPDNADSAEFSQQITVIAPGLENRVWIGTKDQGLIGIQGDEIERFQADSEQDGSLTGNEVLTIYQEADGPLWVSTKDGGLNRFDSNTGQFSLVPIESDRGAHAALDITLAKDDTLWLGTAGGGLLRWPGPERRANITAFTHYSKDTGLVGNSVRNILEDQNGLLWLASNRGLTRLDPSNGQTRHFDRNNGLRGDHFYQGAKLSSRSGRLYFGSSAGLVAFYANAITPLRDAPRVFLQAASREELLARAFNTSEQGQSRGVPELDLKDTDDFISFRFSALNYVSPSQNQYQYRLQGFDPDWIEPQGAPVATYTSLAPGNYRFDVRAANPEGVWSEHPASIALEVHAPWWRSSTALAAYTMAIVGLIAFFLARLQLELRRTRSARRTLETQVELRTVELEERNRQLVELNNRLQEASITDPLTGLLNRRSFFEFVSREVASVERGFTNADGQADPERRHLFFMMIDLDGFKPINDTFGHHTGDHTLVQVSDLLTSCAREADTVFRWGGDEFLIIGQVQQSSDLEVLAERFRSTIADHRFDPKYGKALRLSASIGLAPYPFCEHNPGMATWEQVADIADLAACLAKTHGKNAWVCARGTKELNTQALHQVKDRLDLLIEAQVISAVTSTTEIPIPGATQRP